MFEASLFVGYIVASPCYKMQFIWPMYRHTLRHVRLPDQSRHWSYMRDHRLYEEKCHSLINLEYMVHAYASKYRNTFVCYNYFCLILSQFYHLEYIVRQYILLSCHCNPFCVSIYNYIPPNSSDSYVGWIRMFLQHSYIPKKWISVPKFVTELLYSRNNIEKFSFASQHNAFYGYRKSDNIFPLPLFLRCIYFYSSMEK